MIITLSMKVIKFVKKLELVGMVRCTRFWVRYDAARSMNFF